MKKRRIILLVCICMMICSVKTVSAENCEAGMENYSIDITNVVVPTTFVMAFNPDGLPVSMKADGSVISRDQILSLNYGIVNKSSKDMIVQVDIELNDMNGADNNGESLITFVSSEDEVTHAQQGSYVIYLTAEAADMNQDIRDANGAVIDRDTAASALAGIEMVVSSNPSDKIVIGQKGTLIFKLEKAVYISEDAGGINEQDTATSGSAKITAATSGSAVSASDHMTDTSNEYSISSLGTNGYTAFTLSGQMNTNTSWDLLIKGISVKVTYSFEDASDTDDTYGLINYQ